MYKIIVGKAKTTAHNRIVCAPFGRLPQNTSRAAPFVVFCSSTFFYARKNALHFSLSGTKKRRIQPERYVKLVFELVGKLYNKL